MKNIKKKTNLINNEEIKDLVPNYDDNIQLRQFMNAIHEATIPFKELMKTKVKT